MNIFKIAGNVAAAALVLGVGAVSASAQDVIVLPTTGDREINVGGSFQFNNNQPYFLTATYGVFVNPALEVGGTGSIAGAKVGGSSTSIGGFADYHFRNATETQMLPFLGAFLGFTHTPGNDDTSVGAQGGIKYFVNSNVALTAQLQYRSVGGGNSNTQFVFGFSNFFH